MGIKNDPRHNSRKLALSSIFSWLFSDVSEDVSLEFSKDVLGCGEFDIQLAKDIVKGVTANRDLIDNIIQECAPEWPLDKISKVDLVILRIAIYEILHNDKIPIKVAIDEAIELAKEFSNETSSKFVNGVLGTVVERKSEWINT